MYRGCQGVECLGVRLHIPNEYETDLSYPYTMMLITLLIDWGGFVAIARCLSCWLRKLVDLDRDGILHPIHKHVKSLIAIVMPKVN